MLRGLNSGFPGFGQGSGFRALGLRVMGHIFGMQDQMKKKMESAIETGGSVAVGGLRSGIKDLGFGVAEQETRL